MLARGILIVGGRDAGWSELVVVLVVCMLRRAAVAGPILEGEPLRVDTSVSGAVSRVVALVRERARRDGWRDRD